MKFRRGFSLIEVLIAVFVVSLCAVVVAATMPTANRSRRKADLTSKAVGLAQKQVEAIRGLGYANATASQLQTYGLIDSVSPVSTDTYSFTNSDSARLDNPSRVLPSGVGRVKIEQADIDLRRITVTVTWSDMGTTRSFTLGTLVANL